MATRSGSKPKTARLLANVPAAVVNEISLLDRLSILASILLSLEQSATASAAEPSSPGEQAGGEPATSDTSVAVVGGANPAATVEIAVIADDPSTHGLTEDTGKSTPGVEPHLVAQAGPDPNLLIAPPPAEPAIKPIAPHGSSTSPTLLRIEVVDDKAGSAPLSLEKLVVATPLSDVIVSQLPATTFAFSGAAGPNNFDVFIGTGHGNAVDFSGLTDLVKALQGPEDATTKHDASAPNGVFVDLTAQAQTVDTAVGPVTVQAWQLDGDGKAVMPLAHLENIDNVTGTVGNDILVGNANANTFTYTAADGSNTGESASYGFDIYYGGPRTEAVAASDLDDRVDFSKLGTQDSLDATGMDQILLPYDAKGISIDLGHSLTIASVDPETGEATTVTGSVVSTIGGSEQMDLALLAWSAPHDDHAGEATIEHIVTSGGADAIRGNNADNTVVVTGTGANGPVFFDGRGGNDTVDFSKLALSDSNTGIEVHLNQTHDDVTDQTGAVQSDVVQVSLLSQDPDKSAPVAELANVENVVGSRGNDVIEGDSKDNVLVGGGGSDTFVFGDVAVVDGRGVTDIGHDIIRDFRHDGLTSDDYLVFDSRIFNFHDGSSLDWLQQLLTNNQIRDDGQGVIIWIDDNNSVTLQNYDLDDHSGHAAGLSAYASWIVFV